MDSENSYLDRYFQFCENYQEICTTIIENQNRISTTLVNLIRPNGINNNGINNNGINTSRTIPLRNMNQSRYNFARPLRTNGQPISPINNFSRVYSFPLNVNNLQSDLSQNMNNIFRDLLNTTTNSFFSSVPVVPTQEQINTACEIINYSNDVNYNQSNCPISLTRFTPGQEIMRIRYCGHIFIPSHLRQWFSLNTRCPVCR